IKRGLSALSPSASRSLLMAVFSPESKPTNVSDGQSLFCKYSRVTTSPGCSSNVIRTRNGCSCSLTMNPFRRSSPALTSTSKIPKRMDFDTESPELQGEDGPPSNIPLRFRRFKATYFGEDNLVNLSS